MTFLKSFRVINWVFFIIGFTPFLINSDGIKWKRIYFVIILTIFAIYEALTIYSTYDAYLRRGLVGVIKSTFTISSFMRVTLENIMQCLTVLFALTSTKRHIELFGRMQRIERSLKKKFHLSINYSRITRKFYVECLILASIILSIDIFRAVAFSEDIHHFDDLVYIFCISCQMIMLGWKILYVRHISGILIMWSRKLIKKTHFYLAFKSVNPVAKNQCQFIEDILEIAQELADLKIVYEGAFGYILLFAVVYEVICLTFKSYFVVLAVFYPKVDHNLSLILHFGNVIPYMVKLPILIMTLHNTKEMSKLYYEIAMKCSNMRSKCNGISENSIDLIFMKLQHMQKTKYISAHGYLVVNKRLLQHIVSILTTHMVILMQFQQYDDATLKEKN